MTNDRWTSERVARLREMRGASTPFSAIASELNRARKVYEPPFTREACIGKAYRMKLCVPSRQRASSEARA